MRLSISDEIKYIWCHTMILFFLWYLYIRIVPTRFNLHVRIDLVLYCTDISDKSQSSIKNYIVIPMGCLMKFTYHGIEIKRTIYVAFCLRNVIRSMNCLKSKRVGVFLWYIHYIFRFLCKANTGLFSVMIYIWHSVKWSNYLTKNIFQVISLHVCHLINKVHWY